MRKSVWVMTFLLVLIAIFSALYGRGPNGATSSTKETEEEVIQGITFVSIPAGSFQMGSNGGDSNEKPVHTVTLDGFAISKTEVTQRQYKRIMGKNPSYFTGDDNLPVENVSWFDAVRFCNRLSDAVGLARCYDEDTWKCDFRANGFRLPTEAEWEYASRAGTTTKYYTGNNESDLRQAGWYLYNSDNKTHSVAQKEANSWGLYDMHGNVAEWCNDMAGQDYYEYSPADNPIGVKFGLARIIRGGTYHSIPSKCRAAKRFFERPGQMSRSIGFRVVRRTGN